MARVGVVLETMGRRARLTTALRGVCEGCGDKDSCGVSGADDAGPDELIMAENPVGARVGDQVSFDLPGHAELGVSLLVWGLPVVGMVLGVVLGALGAEAVGMQADTGGLVGAGLGLVLAVALMVAADRRARGNQQLIPKILKVVRPCDSNRVTHGGS